jgi:tetratricopeptide (TPR) repeat protein
VASLLPQCWLADQSIVPLRLWTSVLGLLRRSHVLFALLLLAVLQVAWLVSRYAGATAGIVALALLGGMVAMHWSISRWAHRQLAEQALAAEAAFLVGNHLEALQCCDVAVKILQKRKLTADDLVAMVFVIRSKASHRLGNHDEALADAARAFACTCAVKRLHTQVAILDQLGSVLLEMGHALRAIPILEAAVGLGQRAEGGLSRTTLRLERVGLAYLRVGVHANSVAAFGKVIDILTREKGQDASLLASPHINLGNGYKRMQQFQDAERCYHEALRIYQVNGIEDPEQLSIALLNIGVVCAETGRNEEAERYYLRVLEMRIQTLGRNHWRVGHTYNNLANCRRRLRDFVSAEDYAQKAVEILDARPESLCNAIETQSRIFEDQGRVEEALAATTRAREVQQNLSSPDLSELATLFDREGLLAGRSGDEERAADCRSQAGQIRRTLAAVPPADCDLTNIQDSLKTLERHLAASLERVKSLQHTA